MPTEVAAATPFISYSREDQAAARKLYAFLRDHGLEPRMDQHVISAGSSWLEVIQDQIRTSTHIVALWSRSSSESRMVHSEIILGSALGLTIVFQRLDDTPLPEHMGQLHYLDTPFEPARVLQELEPSALVEEDADSSGEILSRLGEALVVDPALLNPQSMTKFSGEEVQRFDRKLTESSGSDSATSQGIDELLAHRNLAVIEGEMGSGKTTALLQLLAREAESGRPVLYVHLGAVSGAQISSIDELVAGFLSQRLTAPFRQCKQAALAALGDGCILALDGFDEIPKSSQLALKNLLSSLLRAEKQRVRIVITTRPSPTITEMLVSVAPLRIWHLAQLTKPEIQDWIRQRLGNGDSAKTMLRSMENPRIEELARTPLILMMLCWLAERGKSLEGPKAEIIKRVVEVSVGRRSASHEVESEWSTILGSIALAAQQLRLIDVPMRICEAVVDLSTRLATGTGASETIRSLALDSGLLVASSGNVRFTHRAIQEYFCASALSAQPNGDDFLLDYANAFTWEGVIRLYCELIGEQERRDGFLARLWSRNGGLALRTVDGIRPTADFESLLSSTAAADRIRTLEETKTVSARAGEYGESIRVETARALLAWERHSEVRHTALKLLEESSSDDGMQLLKGEFYPESNELFRELSSDPSYRFRLKVIPGGEFLMGDNESEDAAERPEHEVSVASFLMGTFQLTNLAYERITRRAASLRPPEAPDDDSPAVNLTWFDAFLAALRAGCRLPTEAEWEYACRAGTTSPWSFGSNEAELSKYANYEDNEEWRGQSWPVGTGRANGFGLYDMHGNVWEWCHDWFDDYLPGRQENPVGPRNGSKRTRRGGGHCYHARGCRSAFRWGNDPGYSFRDIGVRFACDTTVLEDSELGHLIETAVPGSGRT